jgi:hypothetical protein
VSQGAEVVNLKRKSTWQKFCEMVNCSREHQVKALFSTAIIFCGLFAAVDSAFAQTWTQTSATTNFWSSIACSADGSKLVAVAGSSPFTARISPIYVSTNYGSTWSPITATSNYWTSVAASADGTKLIAGVGGIGFPGHPGPIYTSTNGGATWISNNVPVLNWRALASSADGSILFAVTSFGQLLISTNSGSAWTSNASPNGAWTIASSTDGAKLVEAPGNFAGQICTSTNSGITWVTNNSPNRHWWSVASSTDGTKLAAVVALAGLHIFTLQRILAQLGFQTMCHSCLGNTSQCQPMELI